MEDVWSSSNVVDDVRYYILTNFCDPVTTIKMSLTSRENQALCEPLLRRLRVAEDDPRHPSSLQEAVWNLRKYVMIWRALAYAPMRWFKAIVERRYKYCVAMCYAHDEKKGNSSKSARRIRRYEQRVLLYRYVAGALFTFNTWNIDARLCWLLVDFAHGSLESFTAGPYLSPTQEHSIYNLFNVYGVNLSPGDPNDLLFDITPAIRALNVDFFDQWSGWVRQRCVGVPALKLLNLEYHFVAGIVPSSEDEWAEMFSSPSFDVANVYLDVEGYAEDRAHFENLLYGLVKRLPLLLTKHASLWRYLKQAPELLARMLALRNVKVALRSKLHWGNQLESFPLLGGPWHPSVRAQLVAYFASDPLLKTKSATDPMISPLYGLFTVEASEHTDFDPVQFVTNVVGLVDEESLEMGVAARQPGEIKKQTTPWTDFIDTAFDEGVVYHGMYMAYCAMTYAKLHASRDDDSDDSDDIIEDYENWNSGPEHDRAVKEATALIMPTYQQFFLPGYRAFLATGAKRRRFFLRICSNLGDKFRLRGTSSTRIEWRAFARAFVKMRVEDQRAYLVNGGVSVLLHLFALWEVQPELTARFKAYFEDKARRLKVTMVMDEF